MHPYRRGAIMLPSLLSGRRQWEKFPSGGHSDAGLIGHLRRAVTPKCPESNVASKISRLPEELGLHSHAVFRHVLG